MDEISFSDLQPGQIVWASILDPQGRNRKNRPAIILQDDVAEDGSLFFWVIGGTTGDVDDERLKYTVSLEGSMRNYGRGDPRTGLFENTRFCAFWIQPIDRHNVVRVLKMCPESEYLELLELLSHWDDANFPTSE